MRVKICGLTRGVDVRVAIEAGADAIGLVFDHGARMVTLETARALLREARALDTSVQTIAVVGSLGGDALADVAALDFDGVQVDVRGRWPGATIGGAYTLPAFFDTPDLLDRVERHLAAHPLSAPKGERSLAGLVNLDAASGGGTGELSDWTRAAAVCARVRGIIAGGLTPDNVARAAAATGAEAVDVCSGVESAPGIKDAGRVAAFVAAARGA